MDKSTLSNYGWIVIAVLVLAVMIALASPFGQFIEAGVKSTAQGLFDVNQSAGAIAGLDIPDQEFIECEHTETEVRNADANYTGDTYCKICNQIINQGTYIIPDGGTYYVGVTSTSTGYYTGATATYTAGQELPDTVNTGDVYVYGDYEYRYNQSYWGGVSWDTDTEQNGWGVRVLRTTKWSYGEILESINGEPVTNLDGTFYNCNNITIDDVPTIPTSVTSLFFTFGYCPKFTDLSNFVIPNSVTNMRSTFQDCTKLTTAPTIPNSVTNMTWTFSGCTSLVNAPVIPSSVTNMYGTFEDCTSLVTAPAIPSSVTDMSSTFADCTSLKTYAGSTDPDGDFSDYVIPTSVTGMPSTFYGCTSLVTAPVIPTSVTDMEGTFYGCTSLTTAPVIPSSVTNMRWTFGNCTSLTGTIEINVIKLNSGVVHYPFEGVDFAVQNLILTGTSTQIDYLGKSGTNYCSTCNGTCQNNH